MDPNLDWKFDALLSELDSLEMKLNTSAKVPAPFIKVRPRYHIFFRNFIFQKIGGRGGYGVSD
jgi:hypothetical protein